MLVVRKEVVKPDMAPTIPIKEGREVDVDTIIIIIIIIIIIFKFYSML